MVVLPILLRLQVPGELMFCFLPIACAQLILIKGWVIRVISEIRCAKPLAPARLDDQSPSGVEKPEPWKERSCIRGASAHLTDSPVNSCCLVTSKPNLNEIQSIANRPGRQKHFIVL